MIIASIEVNAQNKSAPFLTKSFSSETINEVVAETTGGNISVSGVNASESRVEIFVSGNGNRKNRLSDDEIKAKVAADYDLEISVNNGKLTATAKSKHRITNWRDALNFSFKIYAPSNVSTNLETSGGNIALTGISGDQAFTTSGGNLNLDNLGGKVKGKTSGGNIYINNCKDELDITTSGGNIMAENSFGHIQVTTSGGSIKLGDLKGKIEAETSGGNIEGDEISGELAAHTSGGNVSLQKLSCSVKASTSGGNIDVSVKTPGNYISIDNSAGRVNLRLPGNTGMDLKFGAMKISTENLQNFSGTNSENEIKGSVNGGGIPITVDAGAGNLHVVFD